jgi:hypothetical protein
MQQGGRWVGVGFEPRKKKKSTITLFGNARMVPVCIVLILLSNSYPK